MYSLLAEHISTLDLKRNNDFEAKAQTFSLMFEGILDKQENNTLMAIKMFYGQTLECCWLAKSDTWPESDWECVSFTEDLLEYHQYLR